MQERSLFSTPSPAFIVCRFFDDGYEFNSDEHYIYYCGQESFRRNGVAIMVNKRVRNAVLGCNLKNDKMISVCLQGKPFNITVIQPMPQPVMLKKLKLNGSVKTYEIF